MTRAGSITRGPKWMLRLVEPNRVSYAYLEEELCELEGDAQQQYWLVVDVPLPVTEVLAVQAVDEE
jgi:hypothetical protein